MLFSFFRNVVSVRFFLGGSLRRRLRDRRWLRGFEAKADLLGDVENFSKDGGVIRRGMGSCNCAMHRNASKFGSLGALVCGR